MEGYLAEPGKVSGRPVVYVDETGIDVCLCRDYGRSERGDAVIGKISGRKFKRVGLAAGQTGKPIVAPMQYDGPMDSGRF